MKEISQFPLISFDIFVSMFIFFNQMKEVPRLFKNIAFPPIAFKGGGRGLIEDKTPFLGKESGVFYSGGW